MAAIAAEAAVSKPVVLAGRIVQLDDAGTVLEKGRLYARDGFIVDIRKANDPPPQGFEQAAVVDTGGTIFPGLIELHNHLPYDVLPLWRVPKQYANRDKWAGIEAYHQLITGPMQVLGSDPATVAAVVRYVETRCLLGGTTTSQGVTLASVSGLIKHFRGLVRNVEAPGDPALPAAATHIADVLAADAAKFLKHISGKQKVILHLSEGTDRAARDHFAALHIDSKTWAITPNLIGIHCVALTGSDFKVFADHGGSMVWSPLSNLLLYGKTARLGAALEHNVPVALGSDWAPSGSKNLLGELKVARLAASFAGATLTDRDLVTMATRTPAAMLGWQGELGSLQPGRRADLIVVDGTTGDPYSSLVDAAEADLQLVMIGGVPRAGAKSLMSALGVAKGAEKVTVGGQPKLLNLAEAEADPDVEKVSVAEALQRLTAALADLPHAGTKSRKLAAVAPDQLVLAVEGLIDNHLTPRPHLPLHGALTGPNLPHQRSAAEAHGPLPAITLDPLTAMDNPGYYATLAAEQNLPTDLRKALAALGPS